MTNYYSELKLSPDSSIEEIKAELLRLEQIWRKREITSPEAATAKLALINEAKKVFASSSSKTAYDRELEQSRRKPIASDPKRERNAQWRKWYDAALEYSKNEQYDLAKTAIEKALSFLDPDYESAAFYHDVANIYRENREYSIALSYANKALVLDGPKAMTYVVKGLIYSAQQENSNCLSSDAPDLIRQERISYSTAIKAAERENDEYTLGLAYSLLAYSCHREIIGKESELAYQPISDIEKKVRQLVEKAISLSDPWSLAKHCRQSLDKIEQIRKGVSDQEARRSLSIIDQILEEDNAKRVNQRKVKELKDDILQAIINEQWDPNNAVKGFADKAFKDIKQSLAKCISEGKTEGEISLGASIRIAYEMEILQKLKNYVQQKDGLTIEKAYTVICKLFKENGLTTTGNDAGDIIWIIALRNYDSTYRIVLTKWGEYLVELLKNACKAEDIIISVDEVSKYLSVLVKFKAGESIVSFARERGMVKKETTAPANENRTVSKPNSKTNENAAGKNVELPRMKANRCHHCGWKFTGLLVKHCSKCGKRKDY